MNRLIDYSSRFRILKGGKVSLVVSALLGGAVIASASPSDGSITSGSVNIVQSGAITNINQSSSRASINWQSFSVANGETVNFNQPNATSITLNRVIGNEKSIIDGALNANGQVWLLNSNGVLFGKNASINTSGLLATTSELSDADFNEGNYNFKNSSSNSVINQGTITVQNAGSVILASNEVVNEGTIKAVLGKVHLVGADSYSLNLNGNSLVNLKIDKGVLDALVSNSGHVIADGGEIYLTSNAVDELLKGVVNNEGIIEANSIDGITGKVELFAHGGTAEVGGSITALDGFVETSGKKVNISDDFNVKTDNWLIDPYNIEIVGDNETDGLYSTTNPSEGLNLYAGGEDSTKIKASIIENALTTSNIMITSAGDTGTQEGNIYVNSSITWDTYNSLYLVSSNNIYINKPITATHEYGSLMLGYGLGATNGIINGTQANYYVNAPINLKAGETFITQLGAMGVPTYWKVITELGSSEINTDTGGTTKTGLLEMSAIPSGNYVLGADIDASQTKTYNDFIPIDLTGNFDGLGHTIDQLYIDRSTSNNIGFFGQVSSASTVRNIGLTNVDITGKSYVAGLAGRNNGIISNSFVTGSVKGTNTDIGGLVGSNNSTGKIETSYSTAAVTEGAGFVGTNYGTINKSYATGDATTAGFVRKNYGIIENSYATGDAITAGFVEVNGEDGKIIYCYSTGKVTTAGAGFAQVDNDSISNSYWDKDTSGQTQSASGTGKTTSEMQTASTFVGWDENIWGFSASDVEGYAVGGIYPFLKNVTRTEDIGSATLFETGFGTEASPFTITNWTQLQNMNNDNLLYINNAGNPTIYYYNLSNDLGVATTDYLSIVIGESTTGWTPIGIDENKAFLGYFDGLGHTLDGLFINNPNQDLQGLFGYVRGQSIKNINLTNVNITGANSVGALAGNNTAAISNVYVSGKVTGTKFVGGLLGTNSQGSIQTSYSTVNVTGESYVGGLVGTNTSGTVTNSYATGAVSGVNIVGGLVGATFDKVTSSYSTGKVTGVSKIGGLFGHNSFNTNVNSSFYDSTVNSEGMSDTAYGKTTEELTTLPSDWDKTIWAVAEDATFEGYGVGLPYLETVTKTEDIVKNKATLFKSGFGTEVSPYTITNWTQLQNINNSNVLSGDYHFDLSNDLGYETSDFTAMVGNSGISGNKGWTSIGEEFNPFIGTFDGLGHSLSGLYINKLEEGYQGLFAYAKNATIKNIGLKYVDIKGEYVGGLVGWADAVSIINSYVEGKISVYSSMGSSKAGGLIAFARGGSSIVNSYAAAKIVDILEVSNAGGLVGSGGDTLSMSNSFWDTDTSNSVFANGGEGTQDGAMGKGYSDMLTMATFKDAQWTIIEDSGISDEYLYPMLANNDGAISWKIYNASAPNLSAPTTTPEPTPAPTPKPTHTYNNGIENVITTIVNTNVLNVEIPKITPPTTQQPMQTVVRSQTTLVNTNTPVTLMSQPILNQETKVVTMSELKSSQENTPNANSDIRVALSANSIVDLVNGGVNLPTGVEQQFYVATEEN